MVAEESFFRHLWLNLLSTKLVDFFLEMSPKASQANAGFQRTEQQRQQGKGKEGKVLEAKCELLCREDQCFHYSILKMLPHPRASSDQAAG